MMRDFLEERGMKVGYRPAMPERQAAVRAGVGSFGCNTFVHEPSRGSYIGIVAMAVSAELEPTTAGSETLCPDDCRRCIEACPTGALYEPYKMNPKVLLTMDDNYFQNTVQQLLYGYIWKKFLQRNAAIALGNSGDERIINLLVTAIEYPKEMVRQYSAWALGRIGGKKSKNVLELKAKNEKSEKVKPEIVFALEFL